MTEIEAFITNFRERKWKGNPFDRMFELVRSDPSATLPFVRAVVENLPAGGTFLDASLSFLPDSDWPAAVVLALGAFAKSSKCEAAESVVSYAALQSLSSLHPHLDTIFRFAPNARAYYENWPWRESGTAHLAFLEAVIRDTAVTHETRLKA